MDSKVKALCLRATDYGETGKILTLATLSNGKITANVRAVRSEKSKLKMCASPLCMGEYLLNSKGNRNIVTGCTIEDSFFNCWGSVERYASAQVILEITDKITYENIACEDEFMLAVKAITAVNYGETTPYIYLAWYLSNILLHIGVDIDEFEIPDNVRILLRGLQKQEIFYLETLEIDSAMMLQIISYLHMILRSSLSEKINSFAELLKIINR